MVAITCRVSPLKILDGSSGLGSERCRVTSSSDQPARTFSCLSGNTAAKEFCFLNQVGYLCHQGSTVIRISREGLVRKVLWIEVTHRC